MVVVRESWKTKHVAELEDSEGEFLQSEPVYRNASPQHLRAAEDIWMIEELHRQLEEAEQKIASAATESKEKAQLILELRDTLQTQAGGMTRAHEEEVPLLKQQLATEEKARKSWKTNCEHLAEQDIVITAQEEEITALKRQVAELQTRVSRRQDDTEAPLPATGISRPEERHSTSAAAGTDPTHVPAEVLSSSHRDSRVDGQLADDPVRPPAGIVSSPGSTPRSLSESVPLLCSADPPDGRQRQRKATSIEFFSGEDPAVLLNDWLPSLDSGMGGIQKTS